MTDVPATKAKSAAKKGAVKTPTKTKSDATLLKDAKERIMRLQVCLVKKYGCFDFVSIKVIYDFFLEEG